MSISGILIATAIVGAVGLFIGLFLGLAGKKFAVEVDPREEEVLEALPGNNCGACGYPGCSGLAAAIAAGEAPVNACPVGGDSVAETVGAIMGVEAGATAKKVAYVKCAGTCEAAKQNYEYYGLDDCVMMKGMQDGGAKACSFGCLGGGTCVRACPFDAIEMKDGIALVNKEECRSCEQCVSACPQKIIEMVPYDQKYWVMCDSKDNGKGVMAACKVGCIACRICEKNCEFDAIHVVDNIAHIDVEKCTNCGVCAEKCPKKIIYNV
ncbi:electron transport complex protein RnfB [Lachnospiraceae bacterium PF1-21]|uniref:Ion-translocating oxidoreductase complex subunit B n=1 Tax=Ohessyouella blattaphilus TaxID=2949333 RepID=A0ABT1EF12_9FIRM|nr:RnfABCDGE type electron transport complex subunit B [Ohessyouella blattaphilus]MCP1109295.1 RnfABCDGE type electron transport complex subunit B [Ohessyouella blattaphilus]MCR8562689.1 RnfABCDGE type electron transport complex subunit B [Ohessyouella blattaphilus]MDL2249988.1 RnfABCDGE type electron transport complex subunit B [Lachnospiraceae bacterium OttesenSCG-928-J05]